MGQSRVPEDTEPTSVRIQRDLHRDTVLKAPSSTRGSAGREELSVLLPASWVLVGMCFTEGEVLSECSGKKPFG